MTSNAQTGRVQKPRSASQLLAIMQARGMAATINGVADAHKLLPLELFERTRTKRVSAARKALWAHLRRLGWSYTEIGDAFGRTRAAVMSQLRDAGERAS